MDEILKFLKTFVEELGGRLSGPLNFRLVVMPTVVTVLAILADRRDAREGRPAPLGAFIKDPIERRRLFRIGVKDAGRIVLMALVLDTAYQLMVFRRVYTGQLLTVAFVCAVVPYFLVRGPITCIARLLYHKWAGPAHAPTGREDSRHE